MTPSVLQRGAEIDGQDTGLVRGFVHHTDGKGPCSKVYVSRENCQLSGYANMFFFKKQAISLLKIAAFNDFSLFVYDGPAFRNTTCSPYIPSSVLALDERPVYSAHTRTSSIVTLNVFKAAVRLFLRALHRSHFLPPRLSPTHRGSKDCTFLC